MDQFEAMADIWAAEVRLVDMVKNVAHVSRLSPKAPADVRENFIARQEAQIDAIARQCFLEGAYRVWCLAADEIGPLREALKPFAHYYDLNDCHERPADDAIEVPIADLLRAKGALRDHQGR